MILTRDTSFKKLTAPGYFNFSDSQSADTAKYVAWFDAFSNYLKSQNELYDSIFRLWQSRDYSSCTIQRTPFIQHLLTLHGIQWFTGTDAQAVALLVLVSRAYDRSTIINFQYLFTAISQSPFSWVNGYTQLSAGARIPAKFAETLVIYSTSPTLPATPPNTIYVARNWTPPSGWTLFPSSSTYYCYGYLSGGNIVWMTPIRTTLAVKYTQCANIASLPVSPTIGDKALVQSDGSGDVRSVYYYNGTWKKITTPNANQGTLGDTPQARAVYAPNGTINSSATLPPVSGPSQGYGIYGGMSEFVTYNNQISLSCDLTTAGNNNLNIIIYLLRKIKPSMNSLFLKYTVNGLNQNSIEILDSGAI